MRVCYLIQTHTNPPQACRLIATLKKASPNAFILVSHDYTNCDFPASLLAPFSDLALIPKTAQGFRSDFSLVQAYLEAIAWLLANNINFDWLVNLSGQDYPIKNLGEFEAMLATRRDDGFGHYFDILASDSPWGKEGKNRYYYQYWRSRFQPNVWQKLILKPIKILINYAQPWLRMNLAYGFSIGLKAKHPPFNSNFRCYGGSFFQVISQTAASYLHRQAKENPALIRYFSKTLNPDEAYLQTILLNAPQLTISLLQWMYTDFTETKLGHPRVLDQTDYSKLIQANHYFARKFDANNTEILNKLDQHLFDI
ncbi:MAG: beta-1,6-N-acetylglucosaminyltransferase [Microcystaceae cyanobacterium]